MSEQQQREEVSRICDKHLNELLSSLSQRFRGLRREHIGMAADRIQEVINGEKLPAWKSSGRCEK